MKTAFIFLLSLCLVLLQIAYAAGERSNSKKRQITGNVTAVDRTSQTITVIKKDSKIVLDISGNTSIVQCTNGKDISDIAIGDKVTVQYQDADRTAMSVTIRDSAH